MVGGEMIRFGRQLLGEVFLGWCRATRGPLVVALIGTIAILAYVLPYNAAEPEVSLSYAMGLAWTLNLICALWCAIACYAYDRERRRMALVFTKPMSRWILWVGRWLGTSIPFVFILTVFYLMIFPYDFREGRHRLAPNLPSIDELAYKELDYYRKQGLNIQKVEKEHGISEARLLKDIRNNIQRRYTELTQEEPLTYTFNALPNDVEHASFCLSGTPFMGAYNDQMMEIQLIQGSQQVMLPMKLTMNGLEAHFPQSWKYDKAKPITIKLFRKQSFDEVGYIMFRERLDIQLFYSGYPPKLNLFASIFVMALVVLMASALGCALGALFSLPVGVFVGTLCLIIAGIASMGIQVTVTEEIKSVWTMISARISDVVAGPFKGVVELNPLMRLFSGIAISWREILIFSLWTFFPWTLICSFFSLVSSVKDEDY